MKALFLYSELAGYFAACLETLAAKGVEIHLVHWPVNKEAPFDFNFSAGIHRYSRKGYNDNGLVELADSISPDVVYCSGWIDDGYLKVCKKYRNKVPVIVGFDNKWKGTLKQRAGSVFSKTLIHRYFSHCWIPGDPQLSYARKLKFADSNILTGFYSCDYNFYHDLFVKHRETKRKKFPHRFIYAARYYEFKGIKELWRAFIELQSEQPNDWELWCLGTGDVEPVIHPQIRHFGFVQPDKIEKYIAESGVFVLPSRFEPWGVAVHEFAAAGFPLLCSSEVNAGDIFLEPDKNGFLFKAENANDLKSVLKKTIALTDKQLFEMGEKSAELAAQITPDKWSAIFLSVLNKK